MSPSKSWSNTHHLKWGLLFQNDVVRMAKHVMNKERKREREGRKEKISLASTINSRASRNKT